MGRAAQRPTSYTLAGMALGLTGATTIAAAGAGAFTPSRDARRVIRGRRRSRASKTVLESALETEMESHLGYERNSSAGRGLGTTYID